jgi:hypothetical protein
LKTTPQEAIGLYAGADLWLERFLTFELRLVMSTATTRAKFRHSGESPCQATVRDVPRLCMLYPGIRFTTHAKNKEKTSVRVV